MADAGKLVLRRREGHESGTSLLAGLSQRKELRRNLPQSSLCRSEIHLINCRCSGRRQLEEIYLDADVWKNENREKLSKKKLIERRTSTRKIVLEH